MGTTPSLVCAAATRLESRTIARQSVECFTGSPQVRYGSCTQWRVGIVTTLRASVKQGVPETQRWVPGTRNPRTRTGLRHGTAFGRGVQRRVVLDNSRFAIQSGTYGDQAGSYTPGRKR